MGGISNVVTQLLILVDIILIGHLMDDPIQVTNYRYISIIPFSLLFLPRVFITTDFVTFTEKIADRQYIMKYIKNAPSLQSHGEKLIIKRRIIHSVEVYY